MSRVRSPAVAGQFYAGTAAGLREQIESAFKHSVGPGTVPDVTDREASLAGLVSPHAGYPYSGPIAAHGFSRLAASGRPDVVVLIGPNHSAAGAPLAISGASAWETPLGTVPVNDSLRDKLADFPDLTIDEATHAGEHSLEVQVPFLQYLYDDSVPILPIVMSRQNEGTIEQLRTAVTNGLGTETNAVLLASTDLTHYEPAVVARDRDEPVLDAIRSLDSDSIVQAARSGHTMCGWGPTASVLQASADLGAETGTVLQYATSGDTAGDTDSVVGYVSGALR
ncbi:putative dioxygenase [Halodesulfurarchaeum formicicum]|uniref:MEMO1 family protein HTSR_1089 n=1 Tax=Halodesulfurarchaeum formicicum TaxID=1873524 RepID=A0A1D8S4J8_9EURY|nr:AmmeMemoRadiSam system protein B [Halodesulfurarchaeum formicicum]AOW80270.1 putative dioxygenase [Halodesulfurarchaeum formicicum]